MSRVVTIPPRSFDACAAVADFVGPDRKRKKKQPGDPRAIAALVVRVRGMVAREESLEKPRELVALYAALHTDVYGAAPAELRGEQWRRACQAAANMVRREFDNDLEEAVEFLRWTWQREKAREQYRRRQGSDGGRIGWVLQFAKANLVTDYRVARNRAIG